MTEKEEKASQLINFQIAFGKTPNKEEIVAMVDFLFAKIPLAVLKAEIKNIAGNGERYAPNWNELAGLCHERKLGDPQYAPKLSPPTPPTFQQEIRYDMDDLGMEKEEYREFIMKTEKEDGEPFTLADPASGEECRVLDRLDEIDEG
jgi:hypothetical protein